jgi:hypothetical protein
MPHQVRRTIADRSAPGDRISAGDFLPSAVAGWAHLAAAVYTFCARRRVFHSASAGRARPLVC